MAKIQMYSSASPALGPGIDEGAVNSVVIRNSNGLAHTAGDIVELEINSLGGSDATTSGTDFVEQTDFSGYFNHVSSTTQANGARLFGVILEDTTASSEFAKVCLRGKVLVNIEEASAIDNRSAARPMIMDSAATTDDNACTSFNNATTTGATGFHSSIKVVALAVAIVAADGPQLALFNGIEGFGTVLGPVGS